MGGVNREAEAYIEGLLDRSDIVAEAIESLARDVRLWRGLATLFLAGYAVMVLLYVGREMTWRLHDGQP